MEHRTINAKEMKFLNTVKVIECLRESPYSRAELSRKTGLTRAAISVITDRLIEKRLIVEGEVLLGKVGRKSRAIRLNAAVYHIVGIVLERGMCSVGIMDFEGNLKKVEKLVYNPDQADPEMLLSNMAEIISCFETDYSIQGEFLGIGITAPGPLNLEGGQILNAPNFELWENINVVQYFKKRFPVLVVLQNDVNALAVAERYFGIGKKYDSYLELNLDMGVGGGIVLEGKLLDGKLGIGSQIGHTTINLHGEKCKCGNIGCGELYASIPQILRRSRRNDVELYTWKQLVDLAYEKKEAAQRILSIEAEYLTAIILNVVNVLSLDAVIMTGEVTYRGELLCKRIETLINERYIGRKRQRISVLLSQIPSEEKMIAACNLVMESFVKEIIKGEDI